MEEYERKIIKDFFKFCRHNQKKNEKKAKKQKGFGMQLIYEKSARYYEGIIYGMEYILSFLEGK